MQAHVMIAFLLWCFCTNVHGFKLRVMRLQMSNDEGAGMDGGFLNTFRGGNFEMEICSDSLDSSDEGWNFFGSDGSDARRWRRRRSRWRRWNRRCRKQLWRQCRRRRRWREGRETEEVQKVKGGTYYPLVSRPTSSDGNLLACCQTGNLNTKANNWKRGQQNFFVGRQLGHCENFVIGGSNPTIIIRHSGSKGGKIDWITLRGSDLKKDNVHCPVGQKLHFNEHFKTYCQPGNGNFEEYACNGRTEFCDIPFNQFTFPGAHNAGTGQKDDPNFSCFYKNHDLNVREQLDFGLRFLDLDVIYSQEGNCRGLETGHGANTLLYQCMGSLSHYFAELKSWMEENPREVVIVHLGELKNQAEVLKHFHTLLETMYPNNLSINTHFQETGKWPTLGQAINQHEQLFIMVKYPETELMSEDSVTRYIKVLKIKTANQRPVLPRGAVSVMSAYGGGYIGSNCKRRIQKADEKCRTMDADFVKLPAYGTFSPGAACLYQTAQQCNSKLQQILDACRQHKPVVNFLFADYPNYMGDNQYTLPEITEMENVHRIYY